VCAVELEVEAEGELKALSESRPYQPPSSGRPSVCRSCGALIGAGEETCAVCGAPSAVTPEARRAARRPVYDRDAIRFARAILTRPAPFTIALLVANIFVFLLTILSSGGENSPLFNAVLIAYGAKTNALINAGQWWRFVTPIFLHGGVIHLLMNMYGLWVLGPYVERLYGSAKFVFFWVVTGIAGVVGGYLTVRPNMQLNWVTGFLFKKGDPVSVGASGALFGLIGVLFVFGIKFRHELPDGFKRAFGTGMLPTIVLNIFIGFTIPVIDNAAHMGGLLAGAALALVVGYKRPGERASVAVFWHVLQALALLVVVASFAMVALRFQGPPPAIRNLSSGNLVGAGEPAPVVFLEAIDKSMDAMRSAVDERDAGPIASAREALDTAPSLDKDSDALREELKALLERGREYATTQPAQRDKSRDKANHEALINDLLAWVTKYKLWAQTNGKQFGIVLKEQPAEGEPDKNAPDENAPDEK
jgi:membrane associated rhomboid family serine protease